MTKELILVTSTFNPTSLEFNSFCKEEDAFIPVSTVSKADFFPIDRPEVISVEHSFASSHCHTIQAISALGDRVFSIGGFRDYCITCLDSPEPNTRDYCWDTKLREWTPVPSLNVPRQHCSLHVFKGNIYLHDLKSDGLFMEVLDNDLSSWTALPHPPEYVKLDLNKFRSAAIETKGFFLVGSSSCDHFYSYKPPTTWELMPELPFNSTLLLDISLRSPVVTDKLLLWLHTNNGNTFIIGFDHKEGVYFTLDLISDGIFPCHMSEFPILAHAGNGILTLAWIDSFHFRTTTLCHCIKFCIHLEKDNGIFRPRVTILSRLSRVGPPTMQVLRHGFYMEFDQLSGSSSDSLVPVEMEG